MLIIGKSHSTKKEYYKRYKITIDIFNNYTRIIVFDKQENIVVLRSYNKKTLVQNRSELNSQFNKDRIEYFEKRIEEDYVKESKPVEEQVKSTGLSEFALFVKEITSLLAEYKYPFIPVITRVNGYLNADLKDMTTNTIYSRIEKKEEWYLYFHNDEYKTKAKTLRSLIRK